MKYCLSSRQIKKYLTKADEIRVESRDYRQISDLFIEYPDKMIILDVLKNLAGNINYNPLKFNIKRKQNSQEYKDAWNKVMKQLDSSKFDDETLAQIQAAIANA